MYAARPIAGGVPLLRFGDNLRRGHLGKLADDLLAQMLVRENPDTFRRQDWSQAIHCCLDHRSFPVDRQNLFGAAPAALRPEARTTPAGEDQPVTMH